MLYLPLKFENKRTAEVRCSKHNVIQQLKNNNEMLHL